MTDALYTTGITAFDELFGPMRPGNIYLLAGRTGLNRQILDRLAVTGARRGDAVYHIDGGHGADPFSMAGILRGRREDPRKVLERVNIARAFTAYQMDSLVRERLPEVSPRPDLLIVSSLDSLFSDPEVDPQEAEGMLANCMAVLGELAGSGACIIVSAAGGSRGSELPARILPFCSNWASLTGRSSSRVRMVTRGGRWRDVVPLEPFQTMLEDFVEAKHGGEAA